VPEFLPAPTWIQEVNSNPVEQQVAVRIQNSLNQPHEMYTVRTQVVADLSRAQVILLLEIVDVREGSAPLARFTKAQDVAKQRGGDSPPRPCVVKGDSQYTSSQQQPVTSASPTSLSAPLTINRMPFNYCAFRRKPAPSARIYLSLACSLLLAFGCNITV